MNNDNPAATETKEDAKAKAKGATPEQKAQATYLQLVDRLGELRAWLASQDAGPLMAKVAADAFGDSVNESGYPGVIEREALALAASACKDINLHLRIELASRAKAKATKKLSAKITDAKKLERAVSRCVSHTGKLSAHDAGAALVIKFGTPAKLDALF